MLNRERIWTKDFIVVCMSSFFMFLNFYILATAFPLYVKDSMNGNEQQMGLSISIYVIGSVLLRLFSGRWIDRFGKKKMAVIGMVVFLLACVGYFGTPGIVLFLVVRFIHGMSYALASTAMSTVAVSMVPKSRQGEGVGYFTMFMSIAMAVGPALGLYLWKDKDIDLLLIAICAIAAVSLVFTLGIRLPGQEPSRTETNRNGKPLQGKQSWRWSDFLEPKALPISLVGFCLAFSYSSLSGFIASFTVEIDQSQVTGYFFVAFTLMIVLFRPVIGRVLDQYTEHLLAYPGIALFAVGMLLLSQAHSEAIVLAAGVVMGIGYGALLPCFQTLAMKLAPEHRRGSAAATFFLLFDLGYGSGSYFMGMIAGLTDYRTMYVFAGFITLISVVVYYFLYHLPSVKRRVSAA